MTARATRAGENNTYMAVLLFAEYEIKAGTGCCSLLRKSRKIHSCGHASIKEIGRHSRFNVLLMHFSLLQTSGHSAKTCTFREEMRFFGNYETGSAKRPPRWAKRLPFPKAKLFHRVATISSPFHTAIKMNTRESLGPAHNAPRKKPGKMPGFYQLQTGTISNEKR